MQSLPSHTVPRQSSPSLLSSKAPTAVFLRKRIKNILHSLEIYRSTSEFRDIQLKFMLNSLVMDILDKADSVGGNMSFVNPIIKDTIFMMLSNPGMQYSLEETAHKYGMNPSYFSRLFHTTTGISFKKYNSQLRIELAKRLLEETDMSILEVGLECGFNTPSNFIRIFREFVGLVPSEYRKNIVHSHTPQKELTSPQALSEDFAPPHTPSEELPSTPKHHFPDNMSAQTRG